MTARRLSRWFYYTIFAVIVAAVVDALGLPASLPPSVPAVFVALFSVAVTFTVLGVQLAASRYSHRSDDVLRQRPMYTAFFALLFIGVLYSAAVVLLPLPSAANVGVVFLLVLTLLGLYDYAAWVLELLSPRRLADLHLRRIDEAYLSRLAAAGDRDGLDRTHSPGEPMWTLAEPDDPLQFVIDAVAFALNSDDTSAATYLIDRLEAQCRWALREDRSRAGARAVATQFAAGFRHVDRRAASEDNHVVRWAVLWTAARCARTAIDCRADGAAAVHLELFGELAVATLGAEEDVRARAATLSDDLGDVVCDALTDGWYDPTAVDEYRRQREEYGVAAANEETYERAIEATVGLRTFAEHIDAETAVSPTSVVVSVTRICLALADVDAAGYVRTAAGVEYRDFVEVGVRELLRLQRSIEDDQTRTVQQVERVRTAIADRDRERHEVVETTYNLDGYDLSSIWWFLRRSAGHFGPAALVDAGLVDARSDAEALLASLAEAGVVKAELGNYTANLAGFDPHTVS